MPVFVIPIHVLEIEGDGYHLIVDCKINGKPARLLLDTGASRTVFDHERIMQFIDIEGVGGLEKNEQLTTGLGTNTMESHFVTISSFELGELKINELDSVVLEMSHVNASYKMLGLPSIDGVLGSDILMKHKAAIYYRKKVLKMFG